MSPLRHLVCFLNLFMASEVALWRKACIYLAFFQRGKLSGFYADGLMFHVLLLVSVLYISCVTVGKKNATSPHPTMDTLH